VLQIRSASTSPSIVSMWTPLSISARATVSSRLVASRMALVAQQRTYGMSYTSVSRRKALRLLMRWSRRALLIRPDEKTSSPKRIGTRTSVCFLMTGWSSRSITSPMSRRTAFDPMSMAAYFRS